MVKSKRKHTFKATMKNEVYGILIITFSVIALSGEATVGRALSKLFAYLLGNYYIVIPIVFIYIGLYVMIRRARPPLWSVRKAGIVLVLLAFTILAQISMIDQKLRPIQPQFGSGDIVTQTHAQLAHELMEPDRGEAVHVFRKQLGGGYVGAVCYTLTYALFGYTGSKLIVYTMLLIGFMLITGLSYVDMATWVKKRLGRYASRFEWKLIDWNRLWNNRKTKPAKRIEVNPDLDEFEDDFDLDVDDDPIVKPKPKRKPIFFQLLQPGKPAREDVNKAGEESPPWEEEDDADVAPIRVEGRKTGQAAAVGGMAEIAEADEESAIPIIRNFEDQLEIDLPDLNGDKAAAIPKLSALADGAKPAGQAGSEPMDEGDEPALAEMKLDAQPYKKPYVLPSVQLLAKPSAMNKNGDLLDYKATARKLEATLESFGVRAKVLEVVRGPSVTRYEIQPDTGVKVSRIVSLTDDIALALAAKDIRMEAPIPGKSAIGIEVPNNEVSVVTMREMMESSIFQDSDAKLTIALGRDIAGQPIVANLAKMPHMLVAGATGSGKSVCINGIITSVLYKAKPDEVKFLMIDPKMVELNVYNGIPHLLAPVVTDPRRASLALKKIVVEMEKRYEAFSKSGTRNIEGYNTMLRNKGDEANLLPYIVVIVDELADLMMVAAGDVEDAITRLAQMARAAGIHLIIATQRPSVDVITGVIKANIPSRIAFGVSSQVDSRTILDMVGAEKLLGRGDMLFLPMGASKPIRVQGAFLSDQEVESVVMFASDQEKAEYREEIVPEIEETEDGGDEELDELFDQAVQIVVESKQASVSLLQRRMRIGYTRAARLIDTMEAKAIVGPYEGSKPREVLISLEQYHHNRISS